MAQYQRTGKQKQIISDHHKTKGKTDNAIPHGMLTWVGEVGLQQPPAAARQSP